MLVMNAETFNRLYPVGTPVFAYPDCRPEDDPKDTRLVTRTRSKASVFGDVAVVMVDGYERISLTHVDVVSEDEWEAARAAETAAPALPVPVGDQPQPLDDQRLAEGFDQFESPERRRARWEAAALAAGREVDRNALRVYMAVADAEQRQLAEEWAKSVASTDVEVQRLKARVAELEALTPAPIQTCRVCGAGYSYGQPCSACEFNARMAAETGGAS